MSDKAMQGLEPFEADMEHYRQLCSLQGIQYTDDDAEDYAESVAIRIIEGGQNEQDARSDQFKLGIRKIVSKSENSVEYGSLL